MKINEPVNTTALALVYMLDGFAKDVLERYENSKNRGVILRDGWIMSMAMLRVSKLSDDEHSDGTVGNHTEQTCFEFSDEL